MASHLQIKTTHISSPSFVRAILLIQIHYLQKKHTGTDASDVTVPNGKAMEHWHQLVSGTQMESLNDSQQTTTVKHWHNLIRHTDVTKEIDEAESNWHRLIQSTPTTDAKLTETAKQHWHNLIYATYGSKTGEETSVDNETAMCNWDKLIEGRIIRNRSSSSNAVPPNSSSGTNNNQSVTPQRSSSSSNVQVSPYHKMVDTPPPGFRLLYDRNRALDAGGNHQEPKVMRLNIRNDQGQFDDVRLKMTTPDNSMLSAHLKENVDGTFTIFCCPSVDGPFDIRISLSGSKLPRETPVLILSGDFSMFKSHEAARIACRTLSLVRWHLTPGLLQRQGEQIVPGLSVNKIG